MFAISGLVDLEVGRNTSAGRKLEFHPRSGLGLREVRSTFRFKNVRHERQVCSSAEALPQPCKHMDDLRDCNDHVMLKNYQAFTTNISKVFFFLEGTRNELAMVPSITAFDTNELNSRYCSSYML